MTINEAINTYMVPGHSTLEELEGVYHTVIQYGDKILLASRYYTGTEKNHYAAVYEFLTNDQTCEGVIGLYAVSDVEFEDAGHAIAWAIENA